MTEPRPAAQGMTRTPDTDPTWRVHLQQGYSVKGRVAPWALLALAGLGLGAWVAMVFVAPSRPSPAAGAGTALENAGLATFGAMAYAAASPNEDVSAEEAASAAASPPSAPPEQNAEAPRPSAPESPPAGGKPAPNPSVAFENAPGVLSTSLYTRRQDTLKAYPTEALGAIALGLEDLRLTPSNKDGRLEVNLAEQLRYEHSEHEIPKRSRRLLDGVGRLLAENPETSVQILSHTDAEGDDGFNLRLSQRRADAVKEYLVSRGVDAERITAVGRGEEAPLVGNGKRRSTRAERAKNRRTELVIESVEPAEEGVGQDTAPEGDATTGLTAANEADGDSPSLHTGDEPRQDSAADITGDRPRGR